jgi:type IV pilus assembly protein PilX
MSDTTLQEKMAGNLRDGEIAFQAGESALRDAEGEILSWTDQPEAKTTTGGCSVPRTDCPLWDPNTYTFETASAATWQSVGIEYETRGTKEITPAKADPVFVIEERQEVLDSSVVGFSAPTSRVYYQVTSRAVGGSDNAVSILQTSVAKRYN